MSRYLDRQFYNLRWLMIYLEKLLTESNENQIKGCPENKEYAEIC
ncbi:hypothetical protein [Methanobacterium subterraneum]|nr:hypothetical protein [Methanobacterium subterraneum]